MAQKWNKEKSEPFVTMADIVVPERATQFAIVADLLPFETEDCFGFVDIGCGEGLLAKTILEQYPNSTCHATDVADDMIAKARNLLSPFGSRVSVSTHNIHDTGYLDNVVSGPVGVVTSSLAIHHCSDTEKAALYRAAFQKLTSPGAMVIIDAVRPVSDHGVAINKKYWQHYIRQQSQQFTGAEDEYEKFKNIPIMFYEQPAEEDKPATLVDNLRMLTDAGFRDVDCFWKKCGFAIFGGYR